MAWGPVSGTVKGVFSDSNVAGAAISAWDSGTGMTSTTQSDQGGNFSFDLLQEGSYKLTATKNGYVDYEQNENLSPPVTGLSIVMVKKNIPV